MPGGWSRLESAGASSHGLAGDGAGKVKLEESCSGKVESTVPALELSPTPWPFLLDPSPGSQSSRHPYAGPNPSPDRNRGQKFLFVFLPLLWAPALRTSVEGGRVAQAAALKQRNPTSSVPRPPLCSEPSAQGFPFAPRRRYEGLAFQGGEEELGPWDPRAAVLVPCPLKLEGRARVSGR